METSCTSSDLTHFRKRIGNKGAERLLKLSIALFNPKIQKEEVVIDTTVQEKNITYPTDSKLSKKVIDICRNIFEIRRETLKTELFESYLPNSFVRHRTEKVRSRIKRSGRHS